MPEPANNIVVVASALTLAVLLFLPAASCPGAGLTPESPEVKRLIDSGMEYLNRRTDKRLGGQCLIGLCFLKHTGDASHRHVVSAIRACQEVCKLDADKISTDIYSTGIAIFFLCEVNAQQHRTEIEKFTQSLVNRQKESGGFGYPGRETGDTSMTQYAAMGLWAARQHGVAVDQKVVKELCDWLVRTQDPTGAWGYQGVDPKDYQRVPQQHIRHSLAAAGLGSAYISAHMLGVAVNAKQNPVDDLPLAFRRIESKVAGESKPLDKVELGRINRSLADGNAWFVRNFEYSVEPWVYYYMYGYERYVSFRELAEGRELDGDWYDQGVKFLQGNQREDGSWSGNYETVDTAFAVLFLMRGTKKMIATSIASEVDGLLLGGRGLPKDTSGVKLHDGVLVGKSMAGSIDEVLRILEDPEHEDYHDAVSFPPKLNWRAANAEQRADYVQRLRLVAVQGAPEAQVRAIEMLSATGDLQSAPTFITLLADEDLSVTLAARDGLRRISRKFGGFGMPDRPQRHEILAASEKWRAWYRSVSPESN